MYTLTTSASGSFWHIMAHGQVVGGKDGQGATTAQDALRAGTLALIKEFQEKKKAKAKEGSSCWSGAFLSCWAAWFGY